MERLFFWPPPAEEVGGQYIGVFVQRFSSDQYHCGFLYFVSGQSPEVLHHHLSRPLSNEMPDPGKRVLCALIDVDPLRAETIVSRARQVAARHQGLGLNFAFSSPNQNWFSSDGLALVSEDRLGLTCSHFVLALFESAGIRLVRVETWPDREEDRVWQEEMIGRVQSSWVEVGEHTEMFLEQIRAEIGNKRVRPDEVGGAILAGSENLPASFEIVEPLSAEIRARLA